MQDATAFTPLYSCIDVPNVAVLQEGTSGGGSAIVKAPGVLPARMYFFDFLSAQGILPGNLGKRNVKFSVCIERSVNVGSESTLQG